MPDLTRNCVVCNKESQACKCEYPTIPERAFKLPWGLQATDSSSSLEAQPQQEQMQGMKRGRSYSGEIQMDSEDETAEGGDFKRRIVRFAKSLSLSSLFGGNCVVKEETPKPTIPDTSLLFKQYSDSDKNTCRPPKMF